jgi:hypothetical protein
MLAHVGSALSVAIEIACGADMVPIKSPVTDAPLVAETETDACVPSGGSGATTVVS